MVRAASKFIKKYTCLPLRLNWFSLEQIGNVLAFEEINRLSREVLIMKCTRVRVSCQRWAKYWNPASRDHNRWRCQDYSRKY